MRESGRYSEEQTKYGVDAWRIHTTQSQIRRITCLIYDFQPLTPHALSLSLCRSPPLPPALSFILFLFKRLNRYTLHPTSCNHIHIFG